MHRCKRRDTTQASDLHDLFLLGGGQLVDLLDELIGRLLDLLLALIEIVLSQLAALLHLLELFDGITADVSDLDLAVLSDMSDILRDLFTLIFRQRREDQTENLTVVLRIDTDVGHLDRLFDGSERGSVVGLDHQCSRLSDLNR